MTQQPTTQSVDPQVVEDAKRQIRAVVQEIAQLSKSDISPSEFHAAFLDRVVQGLAAVGGAIWSVNNQGSLELQFQINIRETGLAQSRENQDKHGRLLRQSLNTEDGTLVAPQSGSAEADGAANPTPYLLVLAPLNDGAEHLGLVEIFQRSGATPATQRGYLRFLTQTTQLAGDYFKNRRLRHLTDRQMVWTQLENFTRTIHRSLNPRETAYTIANEGRRLIECDRVSVAIHRGRKWVVEAVSGQDTFDRRSNTIYLMTRMISAVAATGEPLTYTGDTSDLPPQIEDAIHEYVDESQTKALSVIPLRRPSDEEDEEVDDEVIGALVVEQMDDSTAADGLNQRIEVVAAHSATALANSLEVQNMFLMPVWRALGKTRVLTSARNLPKTISVGLAILVAVLALVFVPADFDLEGKGMLTPITKREVYADASGTVMKVHVRHKSFVTPGQLLVELDSPERLRQMRENQGQIDSKLAEIYALERQIRQQGTPRNEQLEYQGQLQQARTLYASLLDQRALLEQQLDKLKIYSPIGGQVVSWKIQDRLMGRPVQPGDVLMKIANPEGDWELEVEMPENRMGHIADALDSIGGDPENAAALAGLGGDSAADGDNRALRVEYVLASHPSQTHKGVVRAEDIEAVAEAQGEEGSTVTMRVQIDKQKLEQSVGRLVPDITVTARVNCGRRSIGYVWFHDLIAFVQSKVLFRL
ncbi:MAG: efflux RND transporter periplasmic adaptor subunit [Pirellulales bacterium]